MTNRLRTLATAAVFSSAFLFNGGVAIAQDVIQADAQTCQPGFATAFNGPHHAAYLSIAQALLAGTPNATNITADLGAVHDQATYDTLLTHAMAIKNKLPNLRMVVTVPDGTVVLDTSKGNNTYDNYLAKAINENHNTRVAFMAAQHYPCGAALETKLSTTDGTVESYLAFRAGPHLDSLGTMRISVKQ